MSISLNYKLTTYDERLALVNKILDETPHEQLTSRYLTIMSDYLLFTADKNQTKIERKKQHPIITKNREITVNKRQISYEGLAASLETGEDGIQNMIANNKNIIMDPKNKITKEEIETIPGLKESQKLIEQLKKEFARSTGKAKFILKKQIIDTYYEQYLIRASYKGSSAKSTATGQIKALARMSIPEDITILEDGSLSTNATVSLIIPEHVSFLLSYYSQLKEECWDNFHSDIHYLLQDLENIAAEALKKQSYLYSLLIYKVDGKTNAEIQKILEAEYGIVHNEQYISSLWKKKIPKLIAEQAQKDWLIWHYNNEEYGVWKKCGRCGKYKLAHPMFFSKNSTSKDGYYSICKECRNKKGDK